MNVTPRDINEKQFRDAWRGYSQEEVDDFLDKVSETLEALQQESSSLRDRNHALEQSVSTSREAEEMLKKTLVTAQRAAEEAIAKAKSKAEQLVTEAERRARGANEEARKVLDKAEDGARRKALQIQQESEAKRKDLDAEIERLSAYQSELQHKFRSFLDGQMEALDALSGAETPAVRAAKNASTPPVNGGKRPEAEGTENGEPTQAHKVVHVDTQNSADEPIAQEEAETSHRRSVRSLFWREEG